MSSTDSASTTIRKRSDVETSQDMRKSVVSGQLSVAGESFAFTTDHGQLTSDYLFCKADLGPKQLHRAGSDDLRADARPTFEHAPIVNHILHLHPPADIRVRGGILIDPGAAVLVEQPG